MRLHTHPGRSEEHTSERQSHLNLVCRLLLEKKTKTPTTHTTHTHKEANNDTDSTPHIHTHTRARLSTHPRAPHTHPASTPPLSFFLNDTPPTEIYPLPLHAALPI